MRACGASGTRCGLRIFMRSAGIAQTARSRSNSTHSAFRSSPGRTKVTARRSSAMRRLWCAGVASDGSQQSAKGFWLSDRAPVTHYRRGDRPFKRGGGVALGAPPVATAYRNTSPIVDRSRRAVSWARELDRAKHRKNLRRCDFADGPLANNRLGEAEQPFNLVNRPVAFASRRFFSRSSSASASKVVALETIRAALAIFLAAEGSCPVSTSFFATSRASRASLTPTAG